MHSRGGTGRGERVGSVDSGTTENHPDLAGQFELACALGRCEHDGRPDLNRADGSPLEDTDEHGTFVNGVLAAKKNGQGVIGIAYEAKIISYGNTDTSGLSPPWGKPDVEEHEWGPEFDRQIARGIDWMRSLGVGATNMSWFRSYPWDEVPGISRSYYDDMMPWSLEAFKKYVEAGGVLVWAGGNRTSLAPQREQSLEKILPKYVPELKDGWISVVGLETDGSLSRGSFECGETRDWCIAAPIVVLTTVRNGKWSVAGGTSIAAPYVTASLAALKSMFPNLTYHEVRKRIFRTADKTGQYSDRAKFGQGRLNLDAASRPVGGTNFALSSRAKGPVFSTSGTQVTLPTQVIEQNLNGQFTLVFDTYQRAPFKVGLENFAKPRSSYFSMEDLSLTQWQQHNEKVDGYASRIASDGQFQGYGFQKSHSYVGFGRGSGVTRGLARLVGSPLPGNDHRMSENAIGVALRFDDAFGIWHASVASGAAEPETPGFGISSWHPKTVANLSFVPELGRQTTGAQAFGISFASGLERPMGWYGSGALELKGDSVELGWRRNIVKRKSVRLDLTNRVTRLVLQSGPLLQFDNVLLGSASLAVSFQPSSSVTFETELGVERLIAPFEGVIRTAASVDESGTIAFQDVAINGRKLLSFDKVALRAGIKGGPNSYYSVGVAALRDGFGRTESLAGFQMDRKF